MKKFFLAIGVLFVIFLGSCSNSAKGGKPSGGEDNDSILVTKSYHSTGGLWKVNRGKKVVVDGKTKFLMHGENLVYYKTPKGALSTRAQYVDGKREGLYVKYYTDGKVYYQVNYHKGKMDGLKTSYHKNGNVMAKIPYKQGLMGVGTQEYTPDGKEMPSIELKVWYKSNGNSVTVYAQALNKGKVTKRAEFFEGLLVEGKYAHKGLKEVPMNDGLAKITVPKSKGFVNIIAKVKSARNNYHLVTKGVNFD